MAASVNVIMTKPTILIYCTEGVSARDIQNLFWGIEEEGIPYAMHTAGAGDPCQMARDAAVESALAVGIGCNGRDMYLQGRNIPEPLFLFKLPEYSRQPAGQRILGTNAARLVKGESFRLTDALETSF